MKTGILWYSRSGHSRRLADRLAHALDAEQIEVAAPKYGSRVVGYARAAIDSLRQHTAPQSPSLPAFDRVVLCGPVWTSYPAVPLRDVLRSGAALPNSVSLFLTNGAHSPPTKAFEVGADDLGRAFMVTAALSNAQENTEQEERIVAGFLAELEPALSQAEAD